MKCVEADVLQIGVRFLLYIEFALLFGIPVFVGGVLRHPYRIAVMDVWQPTLRILA